MLGQIMMTAANGPRTPAPVSRALAHRRQVAAERPSVPEAAGGRAQEITAAVNLLGKESAELRHAGVRALVRIADEDAGHRQACIDALCAVVRAAPEPYRGQAGRDRASAGAEPATRRSDRPFRHELLSIITGHLRDDASVSWRGCDLDFTGAVFDNSGPGESPDAISFTSASFTGARFTGGKVSFRDAKFTGGQVSFAGAEFADGEVSFAGAEFAGGEVSFAGAKFTGATVNFARARFAGAMVTLLRAQFAGGQVSFAGAEFASGKVSFHARFTGGEVAFLGSRFTGGTVGFLGAGFAGGTVGFLAAEVTGGQGSFVGARCTGGGGSFARGGGRAIVRALSVHGHPARRAERVLARGPRRRS